ncbi:MAG: DMT family protein [Leptospiraceae bacterium]|nr:DMT family protein [Leptospiraceae bacterium]MCK6382453.1 DMT family protein [Leptospiraceae bacterium]NUM42793.1 DMT family protein [Leptospiraceae bacterium]
MNPSLSTILLLCCSNIFMTFAWYGHLKGLSDKHWLIAVFASWGIAFFEYLLQVPANRIGHSVMNLAQLKIIQEVITLTIFFPFAIFYMKEKLSLDYLWAALCMVGAVFFIFKDKGISG